MHSCHVAGIGCRPSACATSPATGNNVQPERTRLLTGETDGAPAEKPDLHAYSMLERRDSTVTYHHLSALNRRGSQKTYSSAPHSNRLIHSPSRCPLFIRALTVYETHHTTSASLSSSSTSAITMSSRLLRDRGRFASRARTGVEAAQTIADNSSP